MKIIKTHSSICRNKPAFILSSSYAQYSTQFSSGYLNDAVKKKNKQTKKSGNPVYNFSSAPSSYVISGKSLILSELKSPPNVNIM